MADVLRRDAVAALVSAPDDLLAGPPGGRGIGPWLGHREPGVRLAPGGPTRHDAIDSATAAIGNPVIVGAAVVGATAAALWGVGNLMYERRWSIGGAVASAGRNVAAAASRVGSGISDAGSAVASGAGTAVSSVGSFLGFGG